MGNEFQKEAFVGKKYEKIMNQKFSIPTLILGPVYWAYRKMLLESLAYLAIQAVIILVLSGISAPIVENIVRKNSSANATVAALIAMLIIFVIILVTVGILAGFLFKTVYEKFVTRKVRKIMDKDVSDSEYEEIEKCGKKGGTSIIFAIIFFFVSGAITGAVTAKLSSSNYDNNDNNNSYVEEFDDDDSDEKDVDDTDKKEDEEREDKDKDSKKSASKTKEMSYEEYEYKVFTDIDISDYIDLDVSSDFTENEENKYILQYAHKVGTEEDIEFSIAQVDTESAEDFIKDVTKKNGLSTTEDMYSADVDDITWYIIGFMLDENTIYYNAFEKNDKVFLYRYQISDSVEDKTLKGSYEDVIYAIKYINNEKTEVEKTGNRIDEEDDEEDDEETTNTTSRKSNNTTTSNTSNQNETNENTNTSSDEDDDENTNTTSKNTNTRKSNSNTNTNSSNTSITITPTNVTYNNAN